MRLHMNKRLANLCFFVLMCLCMQAAASRDTEQGHQEILANQRRVLATTSANGELLTPTNDRGSVTEVTANATSIPTTTEGAPADLSFWTGFVDSLAMIFFVEFGDRVLAIR
jgi:hypothetical protein